MDRADYREVVDRHWRPCFALGFRLTRDAAAAEDLAQEAFLRLLRRGDLAEGANHGAYLKRTVVNLVIDRARKADRSREVALEDGELPEPGRPEGSGFVEAVRESVPHLPRREAEVFTLRVIDELSTRETAGILEITEGSVRRYLYDAVRRLRRLLRAWGPGEES